ncbi:MAG: hypothetical protein JWN62_3887 [Acidimicrobiales bacterium]|nr:hypothetical protein [Acidimicrobiales bacterium]
MTSTLFPSTSFPSASFGPTSFGTASFRSADVVLRPLGPRPIEVRLGEVRPHHSVYVRRRLLVGLVIIGMLTVLGLASRSLLADRGGVPASTPTVRPVTALAASLVASATPPAAAATDPAAGAATASPALQVSTPPPAAAGGTLYLVQPGDTMWSLAHLFHGTESVSIYVDSMVERNGGAALQVGQVLTLP